MELGCYDAAKVFGYGIECAVLREANWNTLYVHIQILIPASLRAVLEQTTTGTRIQIQQNAYNFFTR